ncbi:MAG TPA: hypothetical protein VFO55_09935 [Gemmatimonadaceae bacterium]|nr:hypothetical protein [Gemmatimonadaceae bacterium]
MRLRALSVLGLLLATSAATCDGATEPPPDTCVEGMTMTIGTDVTGAVAGGDCDLPDGDGRVGDSYTFTLDAQSVIRFAVSGSTETGIRIRDNSRTGEQDVVLQDDGQSTYQSFVVLKAGSYTLDISADESDASGTYTVASTVLTPPLQPTGCIQPPSQWRYAMVGVTVSGVITNGDCPGAPTFFVDSYNVRAFSAQVRKITVTLSAGGAVEIRMKDSPALVATPGARNTAGDIVVQFSPSTPGYYHIAIISAPGAGTVTYTIRIE